MDVSYFRLLELGKNFGVLCSYAQEWWYTVLVLYGKWGLRVITFRLLFDKSGLP
jgi:hypothetical protein